MPEKAYIAGRTKSVARFFDRVNGGAMHWVG